MSKVTFLPDHGVLTIPAGRGSTVRLTPLRASPHVLLELRGPLGGDLGGLVLDARTARVLAEGLARIADGCGRATAESPVAIADDGTLSPVATHATPDATLVAFAWLAVPLLADWSSADGRTAD